MQRNLQTTAGGAPNLACGQRLAEPLPRGLADPHPKNLNPLLSAFEASLPLPSVQTASEKSCIRHW